MTTRNDTEDSAKTKWCQMARYHHCLASECMAWRWAKTPITVGAEDEVETRGYCGLVGEP